MVILHDGYDMSCKIKPYNTFGGSKCAAAFAADKILTCISQDFAGTNPSLTKILLFYETFNRVLNVPYC